MEVEWEYQWEYHGILMRLSQGYNRYITKYMPTAGKPYVRFASFLSIALCLGVGVGWGGMLTFLVLRT